MKIDIASLDRENFLVQEKFFRGERLWLVGPHHDNSTKFTKDTLHFRSSLWNENGELVSAGFSKFYNFHEHPEICPPPTSLDGTCAVSKEDGSCLIVSKYKGHLMARTRGTIDATMMTVHDGDHVGDEVIPLLKKYDIERIGDDENDEFTWGRSYLFEWVSARNQIVIKYPEPDLFLIGIVSHYDYSLVDQETLNGYQINHGWKRPRIFSFDSVDVALETVKAFQGMEGIVLYSNEGQTLHKIKGDWYLLRHRFKENCTVPVITEMYVGAGEPSLEEFSEHITTQFDYECFVQAKEIIEQVVSVGAKIRDEIAVLKEFIESLRALATRKEQAMKITERYKGTDLTGVAFAFLDGKGIDKKATLKLYENRLGIS